MCGSQYAGEIASNGLWCVRVAGLALYDSDNSATPATVLRVKLRKKSATKSQTSTTGSATANVVFECRDCPMHIRWRVSLTDSISQAPGLRSNAASPTHN